MSTFLSLAPSLRALLLLWVTMILVMYIYHSVRCVQLGQSRGATAAAVLSLICVLVFRRILLLQHTGKSVFTIPLWVVILLPVVFTVLALVQHDRNSRWQKNHISLMSVKEGFDDLPTGLCYYLPSGLVKLINSKMEAYCLALTGTTNSNASTFWKVLQAGDYPGCVQSGSQPIYRLPGGTAVSFHRNEVSIEGNVIYELIAVDVTEEYQLSLELAEKRRQADTVNRRLRVLGGQITEMTIEEEILTSKIRVHDDLSKALISTRRLLTDPDTTDSKEVTRLWKDSILQLRNERPRTWEDAYAECVRYAEVMDITVHVEGELPHEPPRSELAATAMLACLTNLYRHARGDELSVLCEETEDAFWLTFANNGKQPDAPIQETGGLKNLRRKVEDAGGRMEVRSVPQFELRLTLLKGDRNDAL